MSLNDQTLTSGADFYLTSSESTSLREVRSCKIVKKLRYQNRDDLYLIEVDPVLDIAPWHERYGLLRSELRFVAVATRSGGALIPTTRCPVDVYVCVVLADAPETRDELGVGELQNHAWGELYKEQADAQSLFLK